jgi:hypothetical protein
VVLANKGDLTPIAPGLRCSLIQLISIQIRQSTHFHQVTFLPDTDETDMGPIQTSTLATAKEKIDMLC